MAILKQFFPCLAATVLLILPLSTNAKTFSDVNENTNYSDAIYSIAADGIINGYPDGTFKPDQCVNRAELLKMLFLANKTELYNGTNSSYDNYFSDTNKSEWYWPYIDTALRKNVIKGYSDGTFRPGNCVNRAEAIKMALTKFGVKTEVVDSGFSYIDLDSKAWYFPYVFTALDSDLVGLNHVTKKVSETFGPEQKYYYPAGAMTRAEVAQMIYQIIFYDTFANFANSFTKTGLEIIFSNITILDDQTLNELLFEDNPNPCTSNVPLTPSNSPGNFCYSQEWEQHEFKDSGLSPEAITGKLYYLTFNNADSIISYSTTNYKKLGDSDVPQSINWEKIDFNKPAEELESAFYEQDKVNTLQYFNTTAGKVLYAQVDIIDFFDTDKFHPKYYFLVPNITFLGQKYNFEISGPLNEALNALVIINSLIRL